MYSPEALLAGGRRPGPDGSETRSSWSCAPGTHPALTWQGDVRAEVPPEELVFREAGQPVWTAWAYRGEGPAHVRVERQQDVLLDATIE